ncbi:MAG: alpha/beta hydrolase [Thermoleophilia bacterium]
MSPSPVLLVHGAWGGAWAWGFVQAALEERGIPSVAVDLPSRGTAPSTLADDSRVVREALEQMDAPAVLVGHSYSGEVITDASAGNDGVAHLVYVCAVLPEVGETTLGLMGSDPTPSTLGEAIRATDDGLSTLDPDGARRDLFNDVSAEQSAPIIELLGTHRLSVFGESASALGWKEHPSTYLLTTQDRVFSPELQRTMAARAGNVIQLDAGHIPLLSRPTEIADAIAAVAR